MFQQQEVKKSGRNKFSNYDYFELADIVPAKTAIFAKVGLCDLITFDNDMATLTLVDTEFPENQLVFTSPMRDLELKGANAVQLLGGVETYQRRYLYMAVLDIVEADLFDSGTNENSAGQPAKKPVASGNSVSNFAEEVVRIFSSLPSVDVRKAAAEIIKKHNGGNADYRNITDTAIQQNILKELRKTYG